ncbi:MAG TPA: HEXXH motif-containing putative peptide modification protein [Polyangiaceae bacterium]
MDSLVLPASGASVPDGAVARLRRARAARLFSGLRAASPSSDPLLGALARIGRTSPEALAELLGDPGIGVLFDTGRADRSLAVLAFELACRGTLGARRELPVQRLWSARLGLLLEPGADVARLLLEDGSALLVSQSGTTDRVPLSRDEAAELPLGRLSAPFPEIREPIRFALFDPNPLSSVEAHPDKQGNTLSLGERSQDEWLGALRSAFEVVERTLPELWDEMRLLLRYVLPTGAHEERQQSASYREYVGALYVTLHPQTLSTAEALIHEFQHNKLNLCAQHYPLIENAYTPLYPSPIRPDPRPLMGVLLAVHAFVPVAEFYARRLESEPGDARLAGRLAEVIAANDEGLRTLAEHARFEPAGAAIRTDLERLHARHLALGLALPERVAHVA